MAGGRSRDSFRARGRKLKAPPAFRSGIGEVYRELEKQGKIPVESIERKAEYEEAKAAKERALAQNSKFWTKMKSLVNRLSHWIFG